MKRKGRRFVVSKVNGFDSKALLDTSASHNFLEVGKAKRFGITYTKEHGLLKTVNSAATPIFRVSRGVKVHIGEWGGPIDLSVLKMDDFKMVLGIEFLDNMCAFPVPFSDFMCIIGEGSACMVLIV